MLFLIVGPSGAGKDTVMERARQALLHDPRFRFPRRRITRPAEAGGEVHQAMDEPAFDEAELRGDFALSWSAHGMRYGVPANIVASLRNGTNVVINVSRTVVDEARRRYGPICVVAFTVDRSVLAERLIKRGRESEVEIARRLARAGAPVDDAPDVIRFDNSVPLDLAADQFLSILRTHGNDPAGRSTPDFAQRLDGFPGA
jgi:ribose 1,5-bisphosphokinase